METTEVQVLCFNGNTQHESTVQAETKAHCSPYAALTTSPLPSAYQLASSLAPSPTQPRWLPGRPRLKQLALLRPDIFLSVRSTLASTRQLFLKKHVLVNFQLAQRNSCVTLTHVAGNYTKPTQTHNIPFSHAVYVKLA